MYLSFSITYGPRPLSVGWHIKCRLSLNEDIAVRCSLVRLNLLYVGSERRALVTFVLKLLNAVA